MPTVKDLREKRNQIAEEAQEIIKNAPADGLGAEDRAKFDAIMARVDSIKEDIERVERHEALQADLAASQPVVAGRQDTRESEKNDRAAKADEAFELYLRHGREGLNPEQRALLRPESRAAQTVTTTGGGYLIPQGFSNMLEESMKAYGNVEAAADVFSTETGNTLPWPTVDDTTVSGRLLAINTAVTETAITYNVVNFAAYKFSSDMVTVPVELMQDSAFDVPSHVAGVLGVRLGRVHNDYQTDGSGSGQPAGIVTGASSGVTAAGTGTVTYDELLDLEHSIDPAYRSEAFGCGFMFNDGTLKKLRQMKDGEGRPLWQAGTTGGAPDTINGWPYHINQDMAAMTTGLKPILFGALKKFKIRKVKEIVLLRLDERYADNHQVAFLAFTRFDSKVLDAGTDPLKYITMA